MSPAPERPGATTPPLGHAERLREAVRVLRSEVTILRQATKVAEDNERAALRLAKKETDTVATLRAELEKFRLEHANVEFLCKQALRKVNDQDAELVALLAERDRLRAALTEHAIQCPQCHDVAVRAALTPSPEETT